MDSGARERFAELVRPRPASGAGYGDVLGLLRQRGLSKAECVMVMLDATDLTLAELKVLVQDSPVWAAYTVRQAAGHAR